MALPTNGSGDGLPKKPQQGQRDPRKQQQQGLPRPQAGNTGQDKQRNEEAPRRPGAGLPSIPQQGKRPDGSSPQQGRPRQGVQRPEGGPQRQQRPAQQQLPQQPQGQGEQSQQPQQPRQQLPQRPPQGQDTRQAGGQAPQQRPPQQRPQPPAQQPQQQAPPQEPVQNRWDEGDDDPFSALPIDDVLSDDDGFEDDYGVEELPIPGAEQEHDDDNGFGISDNSSFEQALRDESRQVGMQENIGRYHDELSAPRDNMEAEAEARREGRSADREAILAENENLVPHDKGHVPKGEVDDKGQSVYVNKKKDKLDSFGGAKKRKIKVDEYDERTNKERRSKIVQVSVLAGIGALLAFSIFAVPYTVSNTVSPNEVQSLVQAEAGGTGFPLNAGEGFARDYMQAYLTYTGNESIDNQALQYYQTGSLSASGDSGATGRSISGSIQQDVVFGPTVYGVNDITSYSASYTIGALVSSESTEDDAPENEERTRWEFFQVNVYFDPDENRFYIPPESPALIPEYAIGARTDVPSPNDLGTGSADETLAAEVQPTVLGFMRAWAESSRESTSSIDQYIVSGEAGDHLRDGFDNKYVFANGDAESSITYQAYPNGESEVKVDMTVEWATPVVGADGEESNSIEYDSTYVMTLQRESPERYVVSDFAPKVYISDDVG